MGLKFLGISSSLPPNAFLPLFPFPLLVEGRKYSEICRAYAFVYFLLLFSFLLKKKKKLSHPSLGGEILVFLRSLSLFCTWRPGEEQQEVENVGDIGKRRLSTRYSSLCICI